MKAGADRSPRLGRGIVLAAIAAQAVLALAFGVPGHLSVDSMVQLYEGRTHHFISFHPPMMSLLLGVFDQIVPGTPLFVLLDQGLFTAALLLLLRLGAHSLGVGRALLAAVVVFNPLILAYTGIVWKDVLFAHLTLFGYVALVAAARTPVPARQRAWVVTAWVTLALAASLRQQGILVALPAAFIGAWLIAATRRARWALAITAVGLTVGVNAAILAIADRVNTGQDGSRAQFGLRALLYYDLAGIIANGGTLVQPQAHSEMQRIAASYDVYRIDSLPPLAADSWFGRAGRRDWLTLWSASIVRAPAAYLTHRARHFRTLLGLADQSRCLPLHVGVIPTRFVHALLQRDLVAELGLTPGVDARGMRIQALLGPLVGSPLFSHAVWGLVVVAAVGLLLRRGRARALAWLGAASLAVAGSYFFASIACDFRYAYLLPVTATALLFALLVGARES